MGKLKDRLDKANSEFRTWTDQVNQLIAEAESRACAVGCGREVHVTVREFHDEDQGMDGSEVLGFVRIGDRWRLALSSTLHDEPDFAWTPLSDCSLPDRMGAAPHFGKLFDALITAREEVAAEAKEAASLLRGVLDALPAKKEGGT